MDEFLLFELSPIELCFSWKINGKRINIMLLYILQQIGKIFVKYSYKLQLTERKIIVRKNWEEIKLYIIRIRLYYISQQIYIFTYFDKTITYVMIFNNYLDYSVSGIILKLHISTKISYDKSNWILQRKITRCSFFYLFIS